LEALHAVMAPFPNAGACLALMVVPSFLTRVTNEVFRHFDPGYLDGDCMFRIVNDTNPEHYARHPVWKWIVPDTDCDAGEYLKKQLLFTPDTAMTQNTMTFMIVVSAIGLVARACYAKFDKVNFLVIMFLCERMTQEMQGYTHILHDVTQQSGTILHHSPQWTGVGSASNALVVQHMAEGSFSSLIIPAIIFPGVMYVLLKGTRYSPLIAMLAFLPLNGMLTKGRMQMHAHAHDLGEAAADSWSPVIMWYYKCHVHGHHYDGSFCSLWHWTLIVFDPMLAGIGMLMENGLLQFGTTAWHVMCVGVECTIMAFAFIKGWLVISIVEFLQNKAERRWGVVSKTRTE